MNSMMTMKLQIFRVFLFVSCVCLVTGVAADPEIPLLGENAKFNLNKEVELGRGLFRTLTEKGYIIDDPMLSRYLQDIGDSLLSTLDVRVRDYHFYLVKDDSVNAFAAPGGYIGINMGLIRVSQTEDELASVMAHEIAHVELMHSMQMIEKAKTVNMVSAISILAAILIGVRDIEAANAIVYSGIAGSTQTMINFTRENEYEADRVGVEILKKSEYDPQAMVDFMRILQSREQGGELASIEYLRTHPVSSNRIAEITSRIVGFHKKDPKLRRYQQFKDYLFYLYPSNLMQQKQSKFSLALGHTRNGQYDRADRLFEQLLQQDPDSLWINYAQAESLEYQHQMESAAKMYRSALLLYPDDLAIGSRLVNVLLIQGELQKALKITTRLVAKHGDDPGPYELFVDIYTRLNKDALRELAEANYHWYSGNIKQAKNLFKALLAKGTLDAVNEQLVSEKLGSD